MKKTEIIDSGKTPDGSDIYLQKHDQNYMIMVNGNELMSTRQRNSEERLAEIVCLPYQGTDVQVLIGGLGFGYTLQAALRSVSPRSQVTLAELIPCVIKWNLNKSFPFANEALKDERVNLQNADVMQIMLSNTDCYHGIMMDVDNSPEAFTDDGNEQLYSMQGLVTMRSALKSQGTLGIWSAHADPRFEGALSKAGFKNVIGHQERARPGNKGAVHTLFVGTKS